MNDNISTDYSIVNEAPVERSYNCESQFHYELLHQDLLIHFHIQREKKELQYPKRFTEVQKKFHPL